MTSTEIPFSAIWFAAANARWTSVPHGLMRNLTLIGNESKGLLSGITTQLESKPPPVRKPRSKYLVVVTQVRNEHDRTRNFAILADLVHEECRAVRYRPAIA